MTSHHSSRFGVLPLKMEILCLNQRGDFIIICKKISMLEDSGESPSRRVGELLGKFEQFSVTEDNRSCREILRPLNEADPVPLPSEDIQGEFQAVRDSFQHMKLPAR
jgi:hypothetical protein